MCKHFFLLKSITTILACFVLLSCNKKTESVIPPVNADTITETQPAILSTKPSTISPSIGGYYLALPPHYEKASKKYPLLIFFHGIGQAGNGNTDLQYLLNDGIGKLLKEKKFPPSFLNGGKHYSFIVILPQYNQRPTAEQVMSFINDVKEIYRTDTSRIYLAGLSLGGTIITETASQAPRQFAAIAPMAGIDFTSTDSVDCERLANGSLPVWVFHNTDDPMISSDYSFSFINIINHYNPVILPRLTIFPYYGHDAWTMALDPSYREENKNLYEWMLMHSR